MFEEPCYSRREIKMETDEIKIETNENETGAGAGAGAGANKETVESCKDDEEPLIAKESKISRKLLWGIKLIKKCVTVLIPKRRSSTKVAPAPIQSVPAEIQVQSTIKRYNTVKQAEDNQTVDQCKEQ